MPGPQERFILYSLPLRSDDTPPVWANWEMARGMKEIIERRGMPATWLPRFDALKDPKYRDLCLSLAPGQEVGFWMEITSSHAAAADVPYRLKPGQAWYEAQFCLTLGYAAPERLRLCDAAMELFQATFGRFPRTVAMWMLDTLSANYLAERYGVRMIGLCRNQYGIDGYTLWGGWPNLPYRPSRGYIWQPAATPAEAADYLVYPVISEDLVADYGNDRGIWSTEVAIIQQRNLPPQVVEEYINPLSEFCLGGHPMGLVSCVAENGWQWPRLRDPYDRQVAWLADRAARGDARCATVADFGAWYAGRYPGLSPSQVWYQPPGLPNTASEFGAVMACTRRYRARLRVAPSRGILELTDLRAYPPGALDPYNDSVATERFGRWIHPFLLDAARFRPEGRTRVPVLDAQDPVMALAVTPGTPGAAPAGELRQSEPRLVVWSDGRLRAEWRFGEEDIELRAEAAAGGPAPCLELRLNPEVLPLALHREGGVAPLAGLAPFESVTDEVLLVNLESEAGGCALRVCGVEAGVPLGLSWSPALPLGFLRIRPRSGARLRLRLRPGTAPA